MADIAGLVVGGIALASLFTSCIDCFEYVRLGKGFGKDYQKCLLKLSIVQLRLSRWGESVRIAGGRQESTSHRQLPSLSDSDAIVVKRLLAEIMEAFDEAKKFGSDESPDEFTVSVDRDDNILSIAKKIRTLAVRRQNGASLGKKMVWALFEERQFNKLIKDVTGLVNDLVGLFPAAKATQYQLCLDELPEIVDARNDEQGLAVLRITSDGIDETMNSIVGEAVETCHSHSYINISATDQARVVNGDHINEGVYNTAGHGHSYRDISASGSARIANGNTFGGKSIWDD